MSLCVLALALAAAAPLRADEPGRFQWVTSSLAPKDIGYAIHVREILFQAIVEACEGNMSIKGFWGGILGDDRASLRLIEEGRIQAAGLSGQGAYAACPEAAVFGLPFILESYEETDYLKEKMISVFDGILADRGLKILMWLDQGFDQIYCTSDALRTPADFRGVRFAQWFEPLDAPLFDRLGASHTEMDPVDIPDAIRSKELQAVLAPSIWVVGAQLHTTFTHVNPMKVRYTPSFFVASLEEYNKLPEKWRKNIMDARLDKAFEFNRHARDELSRFYKAIVQYGVVETVPDRAAMERFREITMPIRKELAGDLYPAALLEEMQAHLAEYRKAQSVGDAR